MKRRAFLQGLAVSPLIMSGSVRASAGSADAAAAVTALARETRALYHDAAAGARIADALIAALRQGRFRDAATPDALAQALNEVVAAASKDVHFMVMSMAMAGPLVPPTAPHAPTQPFSAAELTKVRNENFGIAGAEILRGNIGRLDLRFFYRPTAEVRAKFASAMSLLADTAGMIVDLSQNPGGDPLAVAHSLSYFFDRPPFVLNRLHWRRLPIEEFRTDTSISGPNYGERRPIIVQVSGTSYSAAEEFAYDIQAFKRGSVVGQTTGGGANHALPVTLPGGLQAFIPQARAENPVTRTNWEHVGVAPDIAADAASARQAAHRAALERVASSADEDAARLARQAMARR